MYTYVYDSCFVFADQLTDGNMHTEFSSRSTLINFVLGAAIVEQLQPVLAVSSPSSLASRDYTTAQSSRTPVWSYFSVTDTKLAVEAVYG